VGGCVAAARRGRETDTINDFRDGRIGPAIGGMKWRQRGAAYSTDEKMIR
jgi:hypothetical protein